MLIPIFEASRDCAWGAHNVCECCYWDEAKLRRYGSGYGKHGVDYSINPEDKRQTELQTSRGPRQQDPVGASGIFCASVAKGGPIVVFAFRQPV